MIVLSDADLVLIVGVVVLIYLAVEKRLAEWLVDREERKQKRG